ncbi:hypothetical protein F4775DRAFT_219951 [Biscogniauxia sp. FL1348]|nr:hypothetical protein F4775DRAFT_219951 [Biscogniauxia sp. FL1348]
MRTAYCFLGDLGALLILTYISFCEDSSITYSATGCWSTSLTDSSLRELSFTQRSSMIVPGADAARSSCPRASTCLWSHRLHVRYAASRSIQLEGILSRNKSEVADLVFKQQPRTELTYMCH